ncbi:GCN5-related N-acetyltransferase [Halorhabdus utahensis DSM 12940]|uniref:GCN5-related N-acetyltransferase n=1 Tax=Halorhabdus utahensis (strain DSM 12940 / JCM 11049 / AX-2) TaxID=519442 RepID=C7NSY7_HALUD|nr:MULTISPECIES: GNAT family N-acetyltransferase [Halorhabdus]ACV10798.1 GCN5-related N-acetyltransferase [Halorhabdus utahensis DSM 12940]WEL18144.1 Acetyltransferase (GNAT) family [Halorhabdus sp. SVX81]
MSITIREAASEDVPSLEILRRQAIEAACSDVYDRERFADLVATPDDRLPMWVEGSGTVLVAETSITSVGYVVVEDGNVHGIYTSPDYRREGFARSLLEAAQRHAGDHNWSHLRAVAPEVSAGFFEACGFTAVGTDDWHGLPGTVFEKQIEP